MSMDPGMTHGMYGSLGAGEALGFGAVGAGGHDDYWEDDPSYSHGTYHNLGGEEAGSHNGAQLNVGDTRTEVERLDDAARAAAYEAEGYHRSRFGDDETPIEPEPKPKMGRGTKIAIGVGVVALAFMVFGRR